MLRHPRLLPAPLPALLPALLTALALPLGLLAAGTAPVHAAAPVSAATAAPQARGGSLPPTELLGGDGPAEPMKDQAALVVSPWGYRYIAGQQDSDLTVRMVGDRIKYVDRGTERWKRMPRACRARRVTVGIAAVCRVPRKFRSQDTMFLEIWPRLGDDHVDATRMPARFRVWVLADAGEDVIRLGAGDDFVNAAQDDDDVSMGAGDDWARAGKGDNVLRGEDGDDKLVGQEGRDTLDGGDGADTLFASSNDDVLVTGPGRDVANGGPGTDTVTGDDQDRIKLCEVVQGLTG